MLYVPDDLMKDQAAPVGSIRDDLIPSAILMGSIPKDAGARHKSQRERRARVLAETRHLLAEGGLESVTLRTLAARSHLSVQTIYNILGNRTQVVRAAIGQYIGASVKQAAHFEHCPNFFLGVAEALWLKASANPAYVRAATLACDGREPALYHAVRMRNGRYLKAILSRNFECEAARRGVDLAALSENIVAMAGTAAVEWAKGAIDMAELRYRLHSAYGLSLLVVMPEPEMASVTHWLSTIRPAVRREIGTRS